MKTASLSCIATLVMLTAVWGQSSDINNRSLEDSSVRARVGNRPLDVAHSVYPGTYGNASGIYVLQWYNNKVRGSFLDSSNTSEVRLYGDNSKPGKVVMEAWRQNAHNGTGVLVKDKDNSGRLIWRGTIYFTELVDYAVRMVKFSPSGPMQLTSTSSYSGRLGNTNIRVNLEWYANGKVHGRYTNLTTRKSYTLTGLNYANGKLYLDEWTPMGDNEVGAVTARISLRKVTVGGRVQWQGRMFNLDKRNFAMSFARTSSTGSGGNSNNELENKLR